MKIDTEEDRGVRAAIIGITLLLAGTGLFYSTAGVFHLLDTTLLEPTVSSSWDTVQQENQQTLRQVFQEQRSSVCVEGFDKEETCRLSSMVHALDTHESEGWEDISRYMRNANLVAYLLDLEQLTNDDPGTSSIEDSISRLSTLRLLNQNQKIMNRWSNDPRNYGTACSDASTPDACIDTIQNRSEQFETYVAPSDIGQSHCKATDFDDYLRHLDTVDTNNSVVNTYSRLGASLPIDDRPGGMQVLCRSLDEQESYLIDETFGTALVLQLSGMYSLKTTEGIAQDLEFLERMLQEGVS